MIQKRQGSTCGGGQAKGAGIPLLAYYGYMPFWFESIRVRLEARGHNMTGSSKAAGLDAVGLNLNRTVGHPGI